MKVGPATQRRLLDLATVDGELSRILHRRGSLPEAQEAATADQTRRTSQAAVSAGETSASDLDRDIRRLERDVDAVRDRGGRDRDLLAGSGVSAKQAVDLQHELETLARRQGVLEDELLEVLEQRELVGADLDKARAELATAEQALTEASDRRDAAMADLNAAEQDKSSERKVITAELPAELVSLYERIRAQGHAGAALLRRGACGGCRLDLDRTALGELRSAEPDEIVRCEECGSILVRTEESGL